METHRPYLWHAQERWKFPPKWLLLFGKQFNLQNPPRKLAYARAATDGRYHGFDWFCPACNALTSGGLDTRSRPPVAVDVPTLPLPKPRERSPEANFCHRWSLELGPIF